MYKYWFEYSKNEPLKLLSHLELMRVWVRAFRRAKVPIAYSQGYNPHPKISFASPLAVGVAGEREYGEIILQEKTITDIMQRRIAEELPEGLSFHKYQHVPMDVPSPMALIDVTRYRITLVSEDEHAARSLKDQWLEFIENRQHEICRFTKKGFKNIVLSDYLMDHSLLTAETDRVKAEIDLKIDNKGTVRPEEIINLFVDYTKPEISQFCIKRIGLFILQNGKLLNLWEWLYKTK